MPQTIKLFRINYSDGSQRIADYSPRHVITPFTSNQVRISFEYIGPEYIEITDHFIGWLNNRVLNCFNTNPILWAISVSTCPEELQPYLILLDDQLTYKGTN